MVKTTTETLAAKLAPRLQAALDGAREDIIANAGNAVTRTAVRLALPVARREVPTLTIHGLDELGKELNTWRISDVLAWLTEVAQKHSLGETPLMRSAAP